MKVRMPTFNINDLPPSEDLVELRASIESAIKKSALWGMLFELCVLSYLCHCGWG